MNIIAPRRLRSSARVAIVAPSGPIMSDEVLAGIDIIRECGLEPVLGPCVKRLKSICSHAGTVGDRVEELNWAFSTPGISAVIGAVGGEGCAELLPYLDFQKIRDSRKSFLGMSDLTALNTALLTQSGLISFNCQTPSIRLDKGRKTQDSDSESFKLTLEMLKSDQPWGSRPFDFNVYFPRVVSSGHAEGIVIGGNLNTFVHLMGTKYMPQPDNGILFIEDVHESGVSVSRELIHLRLAGWMDRLSGIVIGEFNDEPKNTTPKTPSIEDVIRDQLSDGPPCAYGYTFSHGQYTSPIPIGAKCYLDADSGDVEFDFCMST